MTSNSPLRDVGLPSPETSGLETQELVEAYRELADHVRALGEGAYANEAWQRFQLASPLDSAAAARLAIFGALVPVVVRVIQEQWEREGLEGNPEAHASERLGTFGKLLRQIRSFQAAGDLKSFSSLLPSAGNDSPRQGPIRPLAGFDWTVTGTRTAWAGQCFAWPFGDTYCLVTASWQTEQFTYTPVLLGFASKHEWHRSIGRVVGRTLGASVGPRPSVSTYFGFSHYEAAFIATFLHGSRNEAWHNPLLQLSDAEILRAAWAMEEGHDRLGALLDDLLAIQEAESILRQAQGDGPGV